MTEQHPRTSFLLQAPRSSEAFYARLAFNSRPENLQHTNDKR
jgi:hypothetical protein